jgi:hypothetical protein
MVGRRKHPEPLPSPAVREVEGKDVSEGVQTSPMLKPKRRTIRQRLPMKLIFFSCFVGGIVASRVYFPDYVHASSELFVPVGALVEELSRPGLNFSNESVVCRRPFVALPGFVTSALEIWEPLPCATSALTTNFRKQLFGAGMLLTLLDDPECFFRHAALDPDTSLDPEGIKMRAATGFSAIDYIVPGFWVWAKVLRNLADIGYTPHTLHAATYDWRLSPEELASPAVGYFEDLKGDIERLSRRAQRKELPELSKKAREAEGCDRVVIASHSYGSNVLVAFLQWAEDQEPGWTDKNVHAVANIGGPMLGMPKALSALVSGEFRDTAVLPRPIRQLVDLSIPKRLRAWTFRTWSCLWTMLPKSDAIWPRIVDVPVKGEADKKQEANRKATNSEQTKEKKESTTEDTSTTTPDVAVKNATRKSRRLGAVEANEELLLQVATATKNHLLMKRLKSYKPAKTAPEAIPPIPKAPRAIMLCLYGVKRATEVGYRYSVDAADVTAHSVDAERSDSGIRIGDGDGTVPLVSLGYPCRSQSPQGWRQRFGRVVTREFLDVDSPIFEAAEAVASEVGGNDTTLANDIMAETLEQDPRTKPGGILQGLTGGGRAIATFLDLPMVDSVLGHLERIGFPDPRGGIATSDHVDVMGNHELITLLLQTAVGPSDAIRNMDDRLHSRIDNITATLDGPHTDDKSP